MVSETESVRSVKKPAKYQKLKLEVSEIKYVSRTRNFRTAYRDLMETCCGFQQTLGSSTFFLLSKTIALSPSSFPLWYKYAADVAEIAYGGILL